MDTIPEVVPVFDPEVCSPEWYQAKAESWRKAEEFWPQSADRNGVFRKRMLALDEWAKTNDLRLYHDWNKPMILAAWVSLDLAKESAARSSDNEDRRLEREREADRRIAEMDAARQIEEIRRARREAEENHRRMMQELEDMKNRQREHPWMDP